MNHSGKAPRELPHVLVGLVSVVSLILIALAHRTMPEQGSFFLVKIIHSLHGPGFVGVAFFVFAIFRLYHRGPRNYVYTAIIALGVGVLSEIAQIPGPRNAQVSDLIVDAVGIFGALGLLALFDRDRIYGVGKLARTGLAVATTLALTISFAPTVWYSYSWFAQQRAVPTLLSFEQRWERQIVKGIRRAKIDRNDAPAEWPVAGTVLQVTSSQRGGLLEFRPYPDWSQSAALSFVASPNDGEIRELGVLLADSAPGDSDDANRYRVFVPIGPGPTQIRIPLDPVRAITEPRPFDLAHVNHVFLFLSDRVGGVTVTFDEFRLEP